MAHNSVFRPLISVIICSCFLSWPEALNSRSRTRFWVTNHTQPAVMKNVAREISSVMGIVCIF